MCGILGIITNKNSQIDSGLIKSTTDHLFKLSETRGKEASGLFVRTEDAIYAYKQSSPPHEMIKSREYKDISNKYFNIGTAIIGHSRLVTNGSQTENNNNQPVIKKGAIGVHNGIVVNVDDLFKTFQFKKLYQVDSEVILDLIQKFREENGSLVAATQKAFANIKGSASIAIMLNNLPYLVLATNTGSLYFHQNEKAGIFIFASERYILKSLIKKSRLKNLLDPEKIVHLEAEQGCILNLENLNWEKFDIKNSAASGCLKQSLQKELKIIDLSPKEKKSATTLTETQKKSTENLIQYDKNTYLKRCTKCLLPESFPKITFDQNGVCNYCHSYQKQQILGEKSLKEAIMPFKRSDGKPDCLVAFSGGRDSSFGLHYIKKVHGMNPIVFTYDWGMVTDLARRNQARICGKLGVEHIIISADIKKKRNNIRKNIEAWLKDPDLGMVPLFMAGDKQFFYYANKLMKQNGIKLMIFCENSLEKTNFKTAFCGVREGHKRWVDMPVIQKLKLAIYYGRKFIKNPKYINSSLLDTLSAYVSTYLLRHNYLFLYNYIKWDEKQIISTLINEYNWETARDTKSTWRIGDGTAPFYNYIYYTLAGFTENDSFRSNQIREGILTREEAINFIREENRPRYESIKWYAEQIGFDLDGAIRIINSAPRHYRHENPAH